ncbi:hypothetical protein HA402_012782 [Bradysia odoriphaga]|nr:hypothetical protein HA402_012782 [Bradysia odoriphaga]
MSIILKMCFAVFVALLVAASVESAATGATVGPTLEPVTYEYFDTMDYGVYPFLFPRNVSTDHIDPTLLARDCDQHGFNCGIAPFDKKDDNWRVLYYMRNACTCYGRKRCIRYKKSWYLGYWQYRCLVPDTWPMYEK